jgi:hypothetical protein
MNSLKPGVAQAESKPVTREAVTPASVGGDLRNHFAGLSRFVIGSLASLPKCHSARHHRRLDPETPVVGFVDVRFKRQWVPRPFHYSIFDPGNDPLRISRVRYSRLRDGSAGRRPADSRIRRPCFLRDIGSGIRSRCGQPMPHIFCQGSRVSGVELDVHRSGACEYSNHGAAWISI